MLGQNNQISELEEIMARNNLFEKFKLSKAIELGKGNFDPEEYEVAKKSFTNKS